MGIKMKKNFYSIVLSVFLILSMSACRRNVDEETPSSQQSAGISTTPVSSEENIDKSHGNTLIVYFAVAENSEVDAVSSASVVTVDGEAKGRIRALADIIQKNTGGDLFSIQTSEDYPADGRKLIDFAAKEQDENTRPELTSHIENLEEYDTIFIGYPNWWYDMPMVMYSFFDEYDFSNKTIIPFNTHNGSRFSDTIDTIQELETNATIETDGFTVNERDVADSAEDVVQWLSEIGY